MSNQELEKKLWATANKLRGNVDAAIYKHIVLGLIFLKYISDAFYDLYEKLEKDEYADPEDIDEYLAENVFFVPEKARWNYLRDNAKQPNIGILINNAMEALEAQNTQLKGALPKDFNNPDLDKVRLGELVDELSGIGLTQQDLFNTNTTTKKRAEADLLGRVYEYFLGQFASAEGKQGGEFYTPSCIVRLLVEMLEPYKGRIYDGCCGSGGMFVQSEKFVSAHNGKIGDISVWGQESNAVTYRLCRMNLAIRGIEGKIELGDTLLDDKHKDLKADFIMVNPPFNISVWGGEKVREDARWKYGIPPTGNANYAWLQHFYSKLSPNGVAGIILANGSMTSNTSGEGEIRKRMIEEGLVDCMVALPSQLFYNTMIPACMWFIARNREGTTKFRNRKDEILFIDARNMGEMISRRNRELTEADIQKIAQTYHEWRNVNGNYADVAGFCKSASLEVKENAYVLTPGRYVGAEEFLEDDTSFDDKMQTLTAQLSEQFQQSANLENLIKEQLKSIGYDV